MNEKSKFAKNARFDVVLHKSGAASVFTFLFLAQVSLQIGYNFIIIREERLKARILFQRLTLSMLEKIRNVKK